MHLLAILLVAYNVEFKWMYYVVNPKIYHIITTEVKSFTGVYNLSNGSDNATHD